MLPLLAENHLAVGFYAAGYLIGVAAFAAMAQRRRLSTMGVWLLSFAGLAGGLIGANLVQWLGTGGTEAGKTILGGVAGGYLSVIVAKGVLGGAARRVWSDVRNLRGRQTIKDLTALFAQGGIRDARLLLNKPEEIDRHLFRIAIKSFASRSSRSWMPRPTTTNASTSAAQRS